MNEKQRVSIRKLAEEDIFSYRNTRLFCLKNYPDNFGTLYEEEIKKEELYFEKCLRNKDTNDFIWGMFDAEMCIGLCGFIREIRKKAKHRGEIVQMFVHPDYQGQGIGTRLLKAVIEEAFENRNVEQITLSVMSSNHAAIQLYKNAGFTEYGYVGNYFKTETGYLHQTFMILTK
jgi:ribosomal protein S18 acetylase RimI-like enzyme